MASALLHSAGLAASICVGLVFLLAAAAKLHHRQLLPGVVANYRLLPDALVGPVAVLLPFAELVVGIGLLGGSQRWAPAAALVLLLSFAAAMAVNIRRGRRHIDCGCGQSGLRQGLSWSLVGRNLVLAAWLSLRLAGGPALAGVEAAVAAFAGAVLFLLYLMFNAITSLPGRPAGSMQG